MAVNYGSKRTVVGAHYGLGDWLVQRFTAGLMAIFTIVLLIQVIFSKGSIGYDKWAGIFSSQWMKVLTFAVISRLADGVVTVSDAAIEEATRFMVLRMKTVVEPTGAIPAAALMTGRLGDIAGKRVGVIVSGGNVDAEVLARILVG